MENKNPMKREKKPRPLFARLFKNKVYGRMIQFLCMAAVFATTYALILPAITDSVAHPTLSSDVRTTWSGDELSVVVHAENKVGRAERTFVLIAEGLGASLSDDYTFDNDSTTVITDEAGREILLHRSVRKNAKATLDYWFTLPQGESTEFRLMLADRVDVEELIRVSPESEDEIRRGEEDENAIAAYEASKQDEAGTKDDSGIVLPDGTSKVATNSNASKPVKKGTGSNAAKKGTGSNASRPSGSSSQKVTGDYDKDKYTLVTEADGSEYLVKLPVDSDSGELLDGEIINDLHQEDEEDGEEFASSVTIATLKLSAGSGESLSQAVRDTMKSAAKRGDSVLTFRWKEATEHAETLTWSGNGATVELLFDEDANIPADAVLSVRELVPGSDEYNLYLESTRQAALETAEAAEGLSVTDARFFDIEIIAGGKVIEPDASVQVVIRYDDSVSMNEEDELNVVHFASEGGTEILKPAAENVSGGAESDVDTIRFTQDSFSVTGTFVVRKSLSGTLETAEGTYQVTVDYDEKAGIPSNASLKVREIGPDDPAYEMYYAQSEAALDKEGSISFAHFLDITIVAADGVTEIEPKTPVEVKIVLVNTQKMEDDTEVSALHFDDNGDTEILENVKKSGGENRLKSVTFNAESFSVYGIIGTVIEKIVLASDGKNYKITVSCGPESGIPENADLDVTEITKESDLYSIYAGKTESAIGREEGTVGYIRLFDIKIVDKDDHSIKYQPAAGTTVDVRIELAGARNDSLSVVHFADGSDEGDVIDSETDGPAVEFEAEGFSVYAVVDESVDQNARMEVKFYSNGTEIASMYVKNGDTADELETILYDPGAGTLESGEVFIGWILDNADFTSADLSDVMTIAEVRSWAEAKAITEGETHRLDAAICKLYNVTYTDLDGTTVIGKSAAPVKSSDFGTAAVSYTVKMAYTPHDDIHNFEGWKLDTTSDSNVTSTIPEDRIYQNDGTISIKGDISFTVNAPEGRWLIFDENGKGGKYNAPQFVKSDEVTQKPCPDADMIRNGYTFGGWYSEVSGEADAHGYRAVVESSGFTFGKELDAKTTLYAKWTPKETAPYTVIFWTQKEPVNGQVDNNKETGYDLKDSVVINNGRVGQNIPYTINNNNNGDERYVTVNNRNYHYTGFCVQQPEQQVTITPEGDAVLNLYFNRIKYDLRFYLYRRDGNGNNDYQFAQNSASGQNIWGIVNWHNKTNLANMPTTTYPGGIQSQSGVGGNNITGYYIVLSAYYGEDISGKWPTYDMIGAGRSGNTNYSPVSYVMMVGTKLKPNATDQGDGTLKGVYNRMDENILGATNDADGNFLIVRFNSYNDWTYHCYYEAYDGQDLTGKTTRVLNGKTYYLDHDFASRSSNTIPGSQNPPQYSGFSAVMQNASRPYYDQVYIDGVLNGNPQANSVSGHKAELNYYYDRLAYPINYMDGTYFDGNGNVIQGRSAEHLHTSNNIDYDAKIPDLDKNYVPDLPAGEAGYVFAGWYADAACNTPYTFDTMPIGGIIVYAKWVQEQYRVFLHSNADDDPNLEWGSENVSTSFRVDYGGKVSTPTGTREGSGYEFVGWYTDPGMGSDSLYVSDTVLNNDTVTMLYDQTEPTERDKYGNPLVNEDGQYVDEGGHVLEDPNKDHASNRYWITKKLDLYAKWRRILEGNSGINVVYTADDGNGHVGDNAPVDSTLYPDQAEATAQAACTAPEPTAPESTALYFKCWVIQRWDGEEGKYVDTELTVLPGEKFAVNAAYAHKQPKVGSPGEYTYTMQLRAEYDEPDSGLPTHIWWFNNYSDDGESRHESSHQDKDIHINQAVNIMAAPERPGYTFLGWARVVTSKSESAVGNPPTGKVLEELGESDLYLKYQNNQFILNDPSSGYNGRVVSKVAADERQYYHDMYAVWEKKTYTVTVLKVTPDNKYQNKPFSFTPSFPDSVDGGATAFQLVGNESGATVGGTTYPHSKTFTGVPFETEFSISETAENFDVTVDYDCVNADDPSKNGSNISSSNGGQIKVYGDITVRFTNTPKMQKLRIKKVGNDAAAQGGLAGAKFSLTSSNEDGFETLTDLISMSQEPTLGYLPGNQQPTDATLFALPVGTYTLSETAAPSTYYGVADITLNVSDEGIAVTERDDVWLSQPDANGIYTLKVTDVLKTIPLKVIKIDQGGNALAGATFTGDLITDSVTTEITETGSGTEAVIIGQTDVPIGTYTIKETGTPAGYYPLSGDVVITVANASDGTDIVVSVEIGGTAIDARRIHRDVETGLRTIEIMNDAGVVLPSTGGPGTGFFTIIGSALIAGAGFLIWKRRRVE